MEKVYRKAPVFLAMTAMLAAPWGTLQAQNTADEPIISLKTAVYNPENPDQTILLRFMATEATTIEVDFGFGRKPYIVSASQDIADATAVQSAVTSAGEVKVYGDGSKIDYLDFEGIYMTELSMNGLDNLSFVNFSHNQLAQFDFSPYTRLMALQIDDNPFDKGLTIGKDCKELTILNVNQIEHMDAGFDMTAYPALQSFTAWNTGGLTSLDPSACTSLLQLSIDGTDVSTLDVSNNNVLKILNISGTKISSIDISANTELVEFYCDHEGSRNNEYKIGSIDVSKNVNLMRFSCSGNNLTSLDVTKNAMLTDLYAAKNKLTKLDLSKNDYLMNVTLRGNDFDFATLPENPGFNQYFWNPMNPMKVNPSYAEGAVIDLSAKVLREGGDTYAALLAINEENPSEPIELEENVYYTYKDGVMTLLKSYPDSVRMEFFNTLFPEGPLATTNFMLKTPEEFGKPTKIAAITTVSGSAELDGKLTLTVSGASETSPADIYVDLGDGELSRLSTTGTTALSGTTKGRELGIYLTDGLHLTGLAINGLALNSINLDKARELETLTLTDANLSAISLPWNNLLREITITGNPLRKIDLTGASKSFVKNVLTRLDLSGNKLTEIIIENAEPLLYLNVADNKLTAFDPGKPDLLKDFIASGNMLSSIKTDKCQNLENLDVSDNMLDRLDFYDGVFEQLHSLNIKGNNFTFANMPLGLAPEAEFTYAPQNILKIASKGNKVNFSEQCRDINGNYTTFTWKKEDGTPLTEGTDYSIAGGVTTFINTEAGMVYCELANAGLPALSGDDVLRTSLIEVAPMPTDVMASFVTAKTGETVQLSLAATEPNSYIYIDWTGDGSVSEYPLQTGYTLFEATTKADADVKVYAYGEQNIISVFSISGASMKSIDVSKLTNAVSISISGAGLKTVELPQSDRLTELNLENNSLTNVDLSGTPNIYALYLSGNNLSEIDLDLVPRVEWLSLARNNFSSIDVKGRSGIYLLDLNNNNLSEIDLTGCTGLGALGLSDNNLSTIDVSMCPGLRQLILNRNRFTFATLPLPRDEWGTQYTYSGQADVEATCTDGKVDLSSQNVVADNATEYYWFLGEPELDQEGYLTGVMLEAGTDYSVNDGVTSFYVKPDEELTCVMLNPVFPALALFSTPVAVDKALVSGIDGVEATSGVTVTVSGSDIIVGAPDGTPVTVSNLEGMTIAAATADGAETAVATVAPGIYIVKAGDTVRKLLVK